MASVKEIIDRLRSKARFDQLEGMARYGMSTERRMGVAVPELRKIAREGGKDHELALGLWRTQIPDAMILASMIDDPLEVTECQMEEWIGDFNSWDVCDQVCMNLFDKTKMAWEKVREWAGRDETFVKRAAFALIACLAWHDKEAADDRFLALLPVIESGSTDERNFVKKSVNWALRHIGKRNTALNKAALESAARIKNKDSRAARWIASDAIRELTSEAVKKRLKKK